jgi:photosystem II stability/assembly factor-like uncharacterized protein
MRFKVALLFAALAAVGSTSCKKRGGGGGGWLVGSDGLMVQVDKNGQLGQGYELGADESLNGIACRYEAEAWVVGAHGTLLYTADGGESWESQNLGTQADLYTLATQDSGPVFVAGDGVFLTANPDYTTGKADWKQLGDGVTKFRSLAAAQHGDTVLAIATDGSVFSYASGVLAKQTTLANMRAVAVSPDGGKAIVVGDGAWRSLDAGKSWTAVTVDPSFAYQSVRIDDSGDAVAVGNAGLVSKIDIEGRVLTQRVGTADFKTIHTGYTGTGYASGVGGQVYLTHDNGWSWVAGPVVGGTVLAADEIGAGHN